MMVVVPPVMALQPLWSVIVAVTFTFVVVFAVRMIVAPLLLMETEVTVVVATPAAPVTVKRSVTLPPPRARGAPKKNKTAKTAAAPKTIAPTRAGFILSLYISRLFQSVSFWL